MVFRPLEPVTIFHGTITCQIAHLGKKDKDLQQVFWEILGRDVLLVPRRMSSLNLLLVVVVFEEINWTIFVSGENSKSSSFQEKSLFHFCN